jgi:hypothetical protein
MDMLHQLFDNINTLFDEAKDENRGRPKKRNLVIPSLMIWLSKQL